MSAPAKKRATWSEDSLAAAVQAVSSGRLSTYKASTQYDIPRRTLRNHLKSGKTIKSLGRHSIFTKDQERDFVSRIIRFSELGIPLTPKMIRIQAFAFCQQSNIPNNFNKATGLAGKGWLRLFLKRNADLAKRKVQILNPARAQKLNKPIVEDHFKEVRKLYDELHLHYHPEKIYNMDEKGCRLTLHRQPTVFAQKGAKRVHLQAAEHGENVTVVGCANALGNPIPPMILFKGKRKKPEFEDNLPAGATVKMAPKGSMTTELFIVFIQHLAKYKTSGKCLLIFDGAKSHLDFRIADEAQKHDIVLYCLPSNTTHELQPLDKSCYKPFETYWDQEILQYFYETRAKRLTKPQFNILLSKVWSKSMTHANITSGFKATGLYPLNPNAIPDTAFAPSILTERRVSPGITTNETDSPHLSPRAHLLDSDETNVDTEDSRESPPIASHRDIQNLINESEYLPTSPASSDLQLVRDLSFIQRTPTQTDSSDEEYRQNLPGTSELQNLPGTSGLQSLSGISGFQVNKPLVDYSSSDTSIESGLIDKFINRPLPPKRVRIYSSSESECDQENENPNSVPLPSSEDEDVPLAHLSEKSPFHKFMPTPDYGVVKNQPRKKAINYKGQRVTKDLFNPKETKTKETVQEKQSKTLKKEKKGKVTKKAKGNTNKTKKKENRKSVEESWYCHACNEERVADMRPCKDCSRWYHEDCVGLTKDDIDPFSCPDCDRI